MPLVGYIPQQRIFDRDLSLRARDLVRLGLDGHRWGVNVLSRAQRDGSIWHSPRWAPPNTRRPRSVASRAANSSASESRRRSSPIRRVLLADEPLLSLDLSYQRVITELLDARRRRSGTPILFVTHDINPILPMVDRVLYLAPGRWAIGTADEVLTTETLSSLYETEVDVLRVRGRVIVVGTPEDHNVHHVHEHGQAHF